MPSKSKKQARLMAAAAHNPAFAKRVGISQGVAREFNQADKGSRLLRKSGGRMRSLDWYRENYGPDPENWPIPHFQDGGGDGGGGDGGGDGGDGAGDGAGDGSAGDGSAGDGSAGDGSAGDGSAGDGSAGDGASDGGFGGGASDGLGGGAADGGFGGGASDGLGGGQDGGFGGGSSDGLGGGGQDGGFGGGASDGLGGGQDGGFGGGASDGLGGGQDGGFGGAASDGLGDGMAGGMDGLGDGLGGGLGGPGGFDGSFSGSESDGLGYGSAGTDSVSADSLSADYAADMGAHAAEAAAQAGIDAAEGTLGGPEAADAPAPADTTDNASPGISAGLAAGMEGMDAYDNALSDAISAAVDTGRGAPSLGSFDPGGLENQGPASPGNLSADLGLNDIGTNPGNNAGHGLGDYGAWGEAGNQGGVGYGQAGVGNAGFGTGSFSGSPGFGTEGPGMGFAAGNFGLGSMSGPAGWANGEFGTYGPGSLGAPGTLGAPGAFEDFGPDNVAPGFDPSAPDVTNAFESHSPNYTGPDPDGRSSLDGPPTGMPGLPGTPAAPDDRTDLGPMDLPAIDVNAPPANAPPGIVGGIFGTPAQAQTYGTFDARGAPNAQEAIDAAFAALGTQGQVAAGSKGDLGQFSNTASKGDFAAPANANQAVADAFTALGPTANQAVANAFDDLATPNQTVANAFDDLAGIPSVGPTTADFDYAHDPANFAVDRSAVTQDTLTPDDRAISAPPAPENQEFTTGPELGDRAATHDALSDPTYGQPAPASNFDMTTANGLPGGLFGANQGVDPAMGALGFQGLDALAADRGSLTGIADPGPTPAQTVDQDFNTLAAVDDPAPEQASPVSLSQDPGITGLDPAAFDPSTYAPTTPAAPYGPDPNDTFSPNNAPAYTSPPAAVGPTTAALSTETAFADLGLSAVSLSNGEIGFTGGQDGVVIPARIFNSLSPEDKITAAFILQFGFLPPWARQEQPIGGRYQQGGEVTPDEGDLGPPHYGFVDSAVPGRTDRHLITVESGSYVLPADHVAAQGQDNSIAGAAKIEQRFGPPKAIGGSANPYPEPVPVIVAGGEYILSPEEVAKKGGGNLDRGHEILDREVKETRKKHIQKLKSLKGPKKD